MLYNLAVTTTSDCALHFNIPNFKRILFVAAVVYQREYPVLGTNVHLFTFLLKECIAELLPIITAIVNASLRSAKVPCTFKNAVITPLLKKASLDPDVPSNYRPVSNLGFV